MTDKKNMSSVAERRIQNISFNYYSLDSSLRFGMKRLRNKKLRGDRSSVIVLDKTKKSFLNPKKAIPSKLQGMASNLCKNKYLHLPNNQMFRCIKTICFYIYQNQTFLINF